MSGEGRSVVSEYMQFLSRLGGKRVRRARVERDQMSKTILGFGFGIYDGRSLTRLK